MPQTLTIRFTAGITHAYRNEDGLRAVCEALETDRYAEFTDCAIEVIVES